MQWAVYDPDGDLYTLNEDEDCVWHAACDFCHLTVSEMKSHGYTDKEMLLIDPATNVAVEREVVSSVMEAIRLNLALYQYKNEPVLLEAFRKLEDLLKTTENQEK